MTGFRYLLPAEEEMTESAIFYEEQSSGLGVEFLDDIQHAIDQLRENPMLGQELTDKFRRKLLLRFPFSVIYTIEPDSLLIIAIAHQRRRPNYWKERKSRSR